MDFILFPTVVGLRVCEDIWSTLIVYTKRKVTDCVVTGRECSLMCIGIRGASPEEICTQGYEASCSPFLGRCTYEVLRGKL